MDLYQIAYIVAIADEGNISKAARALNITQSALNQQLLKEEKRLGTPLFSRIHRSMVPTYAGRIYLQNARKILQIQDETDRIIQDITDERKGEISVAFSPERGAEIFNIVYPKFHALYPDITFDIHSSASKQMETLLLDGKVDLVNLAVVKTNPEIVYEKWGRELVVLGVPKSDPLSAQAGPESWKTLPEIDIEALRDRTLVMCSPLSLISDPINAVFKRYQIRPKTLFESISSNISFTAAENQVGCSFFPQSYAVPSDKIAYFSLPGQPGWDLTIAYRQNYYLSRIERAFIDMMAAESRRFYHLPALAPGSSPTTFLDTQP